MALELQAHKVMVVKEDKMILQGPKYTTLEAAVDLFNLDRCLLQQDKVEEEQEAILMANQSLLELTDLVGVEEDLLMLLVEETEETELYL